MRTALRYLAVALLCLALLIPCACTQGPQEPPAQPTETPVADEPQNAAPATAQPDLVPPPAESTPPDEPDPLPTNTGDVPALYPDEETELLYTLNGAAETIPAVRHHSHLGYTIVYDAMHYEPRSLYEVDSYWSDVGLYLSVSLVYDMPMDDILDGLQLQENIEMGAELVYIGTGNYPAYTLYHTTEDGLYCQFWAMDYAGDTMLIEQSYPVEHEYAGFHHAVQTAMLDSLTLDSIGHLTAGPGSMAYASALEQLRTCHTLPDGTDLGGYSYDMSDNRFAVYDVDGDGKEELIIEYTATITAGMSLLIYDYDETSGTLHLQFREFPSVTFYDNGVIEAAAAHNHGKGGAFWPYTLYRYDAAADAYVEIGPVDAWDKSLPFDGFPEEVDTSGTGFVYYLPGSSNPVDYEAYRQWRQAHVGEAQPMDLPYAALTTENIAALAN